MDGITPGSLSVSSVLGACARTRTVAHKNGKAIHGYLLRNGIDLKSYCSKRYCGHVCQIRTCRSCLKSFSKDEDEGWYFMALACMEKVSLE